MAGGIAPPSGPGYRYLTISNSGTAPLQLNSIAVTSGSADFTLASPNGGDCTTESFPQGSGCSLIVDFAPSTTGYRTGLLTMKDNAGHTYYAGLAGYGRAPVKSATFVPASTAFAPVVLGNSLSGNGQQIIYFSNVGDYQVTIGPPTSMDVSLTAGKAADFTATNSCPSSPLPFSAVCYIYVAFTPQSAGAKTGTLTFPLTYADKTTATLTATVTGTALTGSDSASLLPGNISFENEFVTTVGAPYFYSPSQRSFVLTNNGNAPITLGTLTGVNLNNQQGSGGDFVTGNYCYEQLLQVGESCSIGVSFVPYTAGLRTGSFSIPITYGDGKKTTLTSTFSGIAVSPTRLVLVDPLNSQFNAEVANTLDTTNEITVTVSNAGTAAVTMGSDIISTNFTITNNGCKGQTINPVINGNYTYPDSCTITVASTPAASAPLGFIRGTLTIYDNAGTGSQQVALEGYVLSAAQTLALSQTTASFGTVQIGKTSAAAAVYLIDRGPASNGTTTNLTQIDGITLGGTNPDDFIETQDCGGTLGFTIAGRTVCQITVAFAPTAGVSGTRSAKVTVTPASGLALVLQLVGQASQAPSANAKQSGAPAKPETVSASQAVKPSALSAAGGRLSSTNGVATKRNY